MSNDILLTKLGNSNKEIRQRAVDGFFLKIKCGIVTTDDLVSSTSKARNAVDSLISFLVCEWEEYKGSANIPPIIVKVISLLADIISISPEAKAFYAAKTIECNITELLLHARDQQNSEEMDDIYARLMISDPTYNGSSQSNKDEITVLSAEDSSMSIRHRNSNSAICCCIVSTGPSKSRQSNYDKDLDDIRVIDEAVRTVVVSTSSASEDFCTDQLMKALYSIRFLLFVEIPIETMVEHPRFANVLFNLVNTSDNSTVKLHQMSSAALEKNLFPIVDTIYTYLIKIAQYKPITANVTSSLFADTFLEGIEFLAETARRCVIPQHKSSKVGIQTNLQSMAHLVGHIYKLLLHFSENLFYRRLFLTPDNTTSMPFCYCCNSDNCRRLRLLQVCASLAELASEVAAIHAIDPSATIADRRSSVLLADKVSLAAQSIVSIQRLLAKMATDGSLPALKPIRTQHKNSKYALMASVNRQLRNYVLSPTAPGCRSMLVETKESTYYDLFESKENVPNALSGETTIVDGALRWIESCCGAIDKSKSTCRYELSLCLKQGAGAGKAAELMMIFKEPEKVCPREEILRMVDSCLLSLPHLLQESPDDKCNETLFDFAQNLVSLVVQDTMNRVDAGGIEMLQRLIYESASCRMLAAAIENCLLKEEHSSTSISLCLLSDPRTALYVLSLLSNFNVVSLMNFCTKTVASHAMTTKTSDAFQNLAASIPLVLVPLFNNVPTNNDLQPSDYLASLTASLTTLDNLFDESDSIALAFLASCSRNSKSGHLRRDGIRKLTRLIPGVSTYVTSESFGTLLKQCSQSPARCTQLMPSSTQPISNTKIDSLVERLTEFQTNRDYKIDLASILQEISLLLHNPNNHDRFIVDGGFDLLLSLLLLGPEKVSLRSRAHLLVALKWLAINNVEIRSKIFRNTKSFKVVVQLLNDPVTQGAAAALVSILSLHRILQLHDKSCGDEMKSSSITLPICFETDFELPIDFQTCLHKTCRAVNENVKRDNSSSGSSLLSAWAKCHFHAISQNPVWQAYKIDDGQALEMHLKLLEQSDCHERFNSAIFGFNLALDCLSSREQEEFCKNQLIHVVGSALGRLFDSASSNSVMLSQADCRCLSLAAQLSSASMKRIKMELENDPETVTDQFLQIVLPRLCRFGVEALSNLLTIRERVDEVGNNQQDEGLNNEASTSAVHVLDFLLTAVVSLLISSPKNKVIRAFAVDVVKTVSEMLLKPGIPNASANFNRLESTTSTALVGLLVRRFAEAAHPTTFCLDMLELLPSSKLFSQLVELSAHPETVGSPLALTAALLPRTIFSLKATAISASVECAIVSLASCEQTGLLSFQNLINKFASEKDDGSGLVAASRLVQLSNHLPTTVVTSSRAFRLLGSPEYPLKQRSAGALLVAACLQVLSREPLQPVEDEFNEAISNLSKSSVELLDLIKTASGVTGMAISEGKLDKNGMSNDLIVFTCSLASIVNAFLNVAERQCVPITED